MPNLIVSRQIIQPTANSPILSKTRIGWTIYGTVESPDRKEEKTEVSLICCEVVNEKLHELVKSYMTVENFGATIRNIDKSKTKKEERAISIVENSIQLYGKQYQVRLPWKEND